MARPVGLRTELIVNLALVLGAALLMGGLLLVRLAERHWVGQRVATVTNILEVAASPREGSRLGTRGSGRDEAPAIDGMRELSSRFNLTAWFIFDHELNPVDGGSVSDSSAAMQSGAERARRFQETDVQVVYTSALWFWKRHPAASITVTVPLLREGEFAGALGGVFSLSRTRQAVTEMMHLTVLFAWGYGAILIFFGAFFLNRNVVSPVRRLMDSTRRVQAGELDQSIAGEGPGEIAELARAFQEMLETLKNSREETEATIQSLRRTNQELQRTRAELIRSEKLASVGHLAAGMAHEIGNPLGAIVGYLELLQTRLADSAQKDLVSRSLDEAARIDRLIRDLLDFASPGEAAPEEKELVGLFREALQILDHQGAFKGVDLVDQLPDCLPAVSIVSHKLIQVFVNLLLNARDASKAGGRVVLKGGAGRDEVWLSIADEGEGIPPEQMENIFDPFFTTKDPGKGRGLGLSVCHRILTETGGRIEVGSILEKGTVFTIRLKRNPPHDGSE